MSNHVFPTFYQRQTDNFLSEAALLSLMQDPHSASCRNHSISPFSLIQGPHLPHSILLFNPVKITIISSNIPPLSLMQAHPLILPFSLVNNPCSICSILPFNPVKIQLFQAFCIIHLQKITPPTHIHLCIIIK